MTGYPDVAWLNIDDVRDSSVKFMRPSVCIDSETQMTDAIFKELAQFEIPKYAVEAAVAEALKTPNEV